MRSLTNWLLALLTLVLLALGAGIQFVLIRTPVPAVVVVAAAAILGLLLALRILTLGARRQVAFLVALASLTALTGVACFQFVVKPNLVTTFATATLAPKPTAVTAEVATVENWSPELTAVGTLRAYEAVIITPQAAGVVTAVHFESGENADPGALLFNMDDAVEQADLASGLAQLKGAEATLVRQKMQVEQGWVQTSVDAALAARDSAAATVERARSTISQKAIRAPFAGRLGLRNVVLGQYVTVGTSLVTLQKVDPIYVDFPVPEEALRSLAAGQAVSMTVNAITGRSFEGKIKAIDARVGAEAGNVTARAIFSNPDRMLFPGMLANLTVTIGSPASVLTVPLTAIVYALNGENVFVVTAAPHAREQGGVRDKGGPSGLTVERRFVRVGAARGERIAIEDGLRAGERVVTAAQIKLQAYMPVTLDETAALSIPAETPRPSPNRQ
jgi:membrane fusion protein (multidrug efflux system)